VIENVYCGANDLASLAPRFISVKRGYLICLVATIVIMPQYLLGSASIFISVLASYQIFLFSIMAVMMAHYYLIAKGLL
jgi:NCS1 family nucleobase:cation symporter-1